MEIPDALEYVTDSSPGFSRNRKGDCFVYVDEKKETINDEIVINRLNDLVIPPIWESVWICPLENGYLQSTGIDLKNRKQYIYHPQWSSHRQKLKFKNIYLFGQNLSVIRKHYGEKLTTKKWNHDKVVALILYLLDHYYFRIGNIRYTKENESYGITTLRRKHIHDASNSLKLNYTAKSGKTRNIKINDKKIARMIREISELPGYEIFRYYDENGKLHKVDSRDVNLYLQEISQSDFTAKNFRTWGASKMALEYYEDTIEVIKASRRKKFESTLVKKVASIMGNTPKVCKDYYIYPDLLDSLSSHYPKPLKELTSIKNKIPNLDYYENMLLHFLNKYSDA